MTSTLPHAQRADIRSLTVDEMEAVGGGLNPQPLPPRWLFSIINIFRFWRV